MNPLTWISRLKGTTLTTRILLGLVLGALLGLLLGEGSLLLQPLADTYLRLMQMTVIPYLIVSLIIGLGHVKLDQARHMAIRGGAILIALWLIAFLIVALTASLFPEKESAAFFSTALVEPKKPFDFVALYVPNNPFFSMANGVIPAVVIFSVSLGVALISLENKDPLLSMLGVASDAFVRIMRFVTSLTPIGVFAIVAVAAGSLTTTELEGLRLYLLAYDFAALAATFWLIPALVCALTPFRFRDLFSAAKDVLITAFVTQSLLIVLPLIAERSKGLMHKYGNENDKAISFVDTALPVSFSFPTVGDLLTLLFVPYVAWLSGNALSAAQYPGFFAVGFASSFASPSASLPFLMDHYRIPHDLFQLYSPISVFTGRFEVLVSAMGLFALGILGASGITSAKRTIMSRLAPWGLAAVLVMGLMSLAAKVILTNIVDTTYRGSELLERMKPTQGFAEAMVLDPDGAVAQNKSMAPADSLGALKDRGYMLVGYQPNRLPLSFHNKEQQLVGFDVDLAMMLASDLAVQAIFVPIEAEKIDAALAQGVVDVVPSVQYLSTWLNKVALSVPYIDGNIALVVRDHQRHSFADAESIKGRGRPLNLGVNIDPGLFQKFVEVYIPDVHVHLSLVRSPEEFFGGRAPDVDALLMPAEIGTAWTLRYPEFTVVVPSETALKTPMGFATRFGSGELVQYVNQWVVFQKAIGGIDRLYTHWVLGRGVVQSKPVWQALREFLAIGRSDN